MSRADPTWMVRAITAIGKAAGFALMNWKTRTGSCWPCVRTRPPREDIALQAQLLVLTTQPSEFITLGDSQSGSLLLPAALLAIRQRDPVADRLRGRFKLAGEARSRPARTSSNLLTTELRGVWRACPGDPASLPRKLEGSAKPGQLQACASRRYCLRNHSE